MLKHVSLNVFFPHSSSLKIFKFCQVIESFFCTFYEDDWLAFLIFLEDEEDGDRISRLEYY